MCCICLSILLGPAPTGPGTMALDLTFESFDLIRTGFILGEPGFLLKMFRLLRLEWIF
jgi:hypothetical protein